MNAKNSFYIINPVCYELSSLKRWTNEEKNDGCTGDLLSCLFLFSRCLKRKEERKISDQDIILTIQSRQVNIEVDFIVHFLSISIYAEQMNIRSLLFSSDVCDVIFITEKHLSCWLSKITKKMFPSLIYTNDNERLFLLPCVWNVR